MINLDVSDLFSKGWKITFLDNLRRITLYIIAVMILAGLIWLFYYPDAYSIITMQVAIIFVDK